MASRMTLGRLIRRRRRELQLSLSETVRRLRHNGGGVSFTHLSDIENDRRKPSLRLCYQLAEVLEIEQETIIVLADQVPALIKAYVEQFKTASYSLTKLIILAQAQSYTDWEVAINFLLLQDDVDYRKDE